MMNDGPNLEPGIVSLGVDDSSLSEKLLKRYGKRRETWAPLYARILDGVRQLIAPGYVCQSFQPEDAPEFAFYLPKAKPIFLALVTLGPKPDARIEELFRIDSVAAVIMDEIASLWVNELTRRIYSSVRCLAKDQNLVCSPAFRPGIGRWPIEIQQDIFKRLPASQIGITLTKGYMMRPQKSVSLILGLSHKGSRV
jgi:hypothetical protein